MCIHVRIVISATLPNTDIDINRTSPIIMLCFSFVVWGLGTDSRSVDILPFIPVSYGDARYAEISTGALYINGTSFANLSEVLAIAESKEAELRDNLLSLEPGKVFYHTLQMCNVAHRCQDVTASNPGIIIRECMNCCVCVTLLDQQSVVCVGSAGSPESGIMYTQLLMFILQKTSLLFTLPLVCF